MVVASSFWQGKRVFLTGHTGFKGCWMSLWLQQMGADVTGYALAPETDPNLFTLASVDAGMKSIIADIRDKDVLAKAVKAADPEIVFHLAAQPLVRLSYEKPAETFETNVMGTVHLLDAVREHSKAKAVVVVTSDKCYDNKEWSWGYRENDPMGGRDPYSSSKGCTELVAASYRDSFMRGAGISLATGRAGNVIGGGDWSKDRLIPDIISAMEHDKEILIRNPLATRPWQHVLEPLGGYMLLAEKLYKYGDQFATGWNFGPGPGDIRPVQWVTDRLAQNCGKTLRYAKNEGGHPHEAQSLSLDSAKARFQLGWTPCWTLDITLIKIAEWYKSFWQGEDMRTMTLEQISSYSQSLNMTEKKTYAE